MSCVVDLMVLVSIVLVIAMLGGTEGISCYQCSTTYDRGCYSFNLNNKYLRECKNGSGAEPVCRLISQVQFFTPDNDVSIIRECAYVHTDRANCELSKFSNVHYSLSCECVKDGCNISNRARISDVLLFMTAIWSLVVK